MTLNADDTAPRPRSWAESSRNTGA